MIIEGGPSDGVCYYETDWAHRLRAAERLGKTLPYVDTGKYKPHPVVEAAVRVWRYVG